jgi:hypothetical protein
VVIIFATRDDSNSCFLFFEDRLKKGARGSTPDFNSVNKMAVKERVVKSSESRGRENVSNSSERKEGPREFGVNVVNVVFEIE